jgi:hypothetical protein
MTDKQKLQNIRRKLTRMEAVLKRPPQWVIKHFENEASPRLVVAQIMALETIRRVRRAAGWE